MRKQKWMLSIFFMMLSLGACGQAIPGQETNSESQFTTETEARTEEAVTSESIELVETIENLQPTETEELQETELSTDKFVDPNSLAGTVLNGIQIVNTAMEWLGTTYSQNPDEGIDCSRLVKATLAKVGVSRAETNGDANYSYLPGYTGQWRDMTSDSVYYYQGLGLHFLVSYYQDLIAIDSELLQSPGNIVMYEPTSGSSKEWHMAFTIGQFENREKVIEWLAANYGSSGFDEAYFAAHPDLVYDYGNGYPYWRIHSGMDAGFVRIDNGYEGHYPSSGWFVFHVNQ
ncbi:MAG: hypothetical protein ACI4C1_05030 [Lachnospiraceae bacterium]